MDTRPVDHIDATAAEKPEPGPTFAGTCATHAFDCSFVVLVAFERARAMVRRDARQMLRVPAAEVDSVLAAVLAETWLRRDQVLAAPRIVDAIRALVPASARSLRSRLPREQCVDPRLLAEGRWVAPETERPDYRAARDEDWAAWAAILARAAPSQRNLLVARFVEGKSLPEVADELGTTTKAVRRRLERAMAALRRLVGRHRR